MNLKSASEAELFALYWLQYFVVPMYEQGLAELWRMRPNHPSANDVPLPIDALIADGVVCRDPTFHGSVLSLVRGAFTADEFRLILKAVETHDWVYPTRLLAESWARRAFPAASEEKLLLWSGQRINAREILHAAQLMHIFMRWGVRAMEYFASSHVFDRDTVYIDDYHGNDLKDDDQVRKVLRQVRKEDADGINVGPGDLDDVFSQYEAYYDHSLSVEVSHRLLLLAEFGREALKTCNVVCGKREEAILLSLAASQAFRRGEDVGWMLGHLEQLAHQTVISRNMAQSALSLAFWRSDRSLIEKLAETLQEFDCDVDYADVLVTVLEGDLPLAAKRLSGAVNLPTMTGSDFDATSLPFILTLLVLWTKAKNNRTALKRLDRYLDELYRWAFCDKLADGEKVLIAALLAVGIGIEWSGSQTLFDTVARPGVPAWLRTVLALSGAETSFARAKREGAKELENVRTAFSNGYLTIAADAVAEIRSASNLASVAGEAAELASRIAAAGGVAAIGPRTHREPWEKALEALEETVLGASKDVPEAERITQGRIVWCWRVMYSSVDEYVDEIGILYIGRKKDGGEKVPVKVSEARLLGGYYDAVMTDDDLRIRNALVMRGVLREKSTQRHSSPSFDELKLFEPLKEIRLLFAHSEYDGYYAEKALPVRIAFGSVRASVTADAGGGVAISTGQDGFFRYQRSYVIRQDEAEKDLWHVESVSAAYRALQETIHELTGGGSLVIPKEGLSRVEKMMTRLGRQAPIAWRRQETEAGDASVRRIPASSTAVMRLRFEEGTLSAHLVTRLSSDPAWTAEPAHGMPERLVVRPDGHAEMLVRDFSAEEAAATVVRQALAAFPTQPQTKDRWTFDGAEESLDALSALHEAAKDGAFELEWPDGKRLDLASVVAQSASFSGGETADYWLSLSGEFKLDDGKVLSFAELLRNFDSREGAYVKLTDARYLKLTAALARRVEALKGAGFERKGAFVIPPAALPSLERTAREAEADEYLPLPKIVADRIGRIRDAFAAVPALPKAFKGTMRPYQDEGYQWLSRLSDCGIGACLADDMGLGKTIQLIALLAAKSGKGVSLVVAPASVAFNWRNELGRFAPSLKVALVGQTPGAQEEDVARLAKKSDVVVTSYGVVASRLAAFAAVAWNILVLDEAQAIKNHQTQRAKSVKELKARFRVAATGTPIENRLTELWSIFDFLNPGMLGGEARFSKELAPHGEATPRLKRLVKPLILRRIKRDVLTDLPEKEEITVPVVLGDDERHAYEATRQTAVAKLEAGDKSNKIAILAELTRLRRFCCHPSLVMPSFQASAKLEALERLLAGLKENGHRALVFSQFVDFLSIVRARLEANGWSYRYLDGATPKGEREKSVAAFQAGQGDFFLISLKAGGMGLNLTAANYVILLDPWWNPAVENQAADRVHRIGQRLPVTVYRLIAQDTIEEKVVNLHAKKTALAEDILASGAAALSAEAMLGLLGVR